MVSSPCHHIPQLENTMNRIVELICQAGYLVLYCFGVYILFWVFLWAATAQAQALSPRALALARALILAAPCPAETHLAFCQIDTAALSTPTWQGGPRNQHRRTTCK